MDHSAFFDKKVTVYFNDPISIDSRTAVHVSGTCGPVGCGLLALNNVVDVSDGQVDVGRATGLLGKSILVGTAQISFVVPID